MKSSSLLNARLNKALQLIPRNANKIAIVGQTSAQLGMAFHHLAPNCELHKFPNSKRLDQHLSEAGEGDKLDAIILLEQLAKGTGFWSSLPELRKRIDKDGVLIVEFANPFYFRQLQQKLSSDDQVTEALISKFVQKAHIFSADLQKAIKRNGFYQDSTQLISDSEAQTWLQGIAGQLSEKSLAAFSRVVQHSHFLFRLTPSLHPQLRIQAQTLKPIGGVNDVRINEPLTAMASIPGVKCDIRQQQRLLEGNKQFGKIFVWHRPVMNFKQSLSAIQKLRKAGYLIVVEFDDHHSPWPVVAENNFLTFAGAHAVQTTTKPLVELFSKYNPEVKAFPNQLNNLVTRRFDQVPDQVRVFFGALNRQKDWAPIMSGLNKALSETDRSFHIDVMMDRAFFEALETDHKTFHEAGTYADYKKRLSRADIALMPLLDTEFNRMKSDLKLVETAGFGAVPVVSPVVYEVTDPNETFSEICRHPDDFGISLKRLLEDDAYRQNKQKAGQLFVKENRMLSDNFMDRFEWYKSLLTRHKELDVALGKRLTAIIPR